MSSRASTRAGATAVAFVAAGSGIAAAKAKPSNTAPPRVFGAARVGQVLTGDRGTWMNSPTKYDYAWLRCDGGGNNCAVIGGANGTQYKRNVDEQPDQV